MKEGKTLVALATELERQANSKRDFVADTRSLTMVPGLSGGVGMRVQKDALPIRPLAHRQIGDRMKIPAAYYDRMLEHAPALLAENVNHWFQTGVESRGPERRMVRTLDGNVRAFLSDRYRPLDNFDLAQAVLPVLGEQKDMTVASCEITERRMYVKALFPRLERQLQKVGDVVQAGIVISNSEVGSGALLVEPLVFTLRCLNGMIGATAMRKHHVGRGYEVDDDGAAEIFREETIWADDRAIWMKVQDVVRAAVSDALFKTLCEKLEAAAGVQIPASPLIVVERMQERFQFTDGERDDVLQHLIRGGDLSKYGLLNAVTRMAQDVPDYDRATQYERLGGQILELPRSEWEVLTKKAA